MKLSVCGILLKEIFVVNCEGNEVEEKEIVWDEVIDFFAKKYISLKGALLGSTACLNGNILDIQLKTKGKALLELRNSNRTIEEFVKNTFQRNVTAVFHEPEVVEDSLNKEREIVKSILEAQQLAEQKHKEEEAK